MRHLMLALYMLGLVKVFYVGFIPKPFTTRTRVIVFLYFVATIVGMAHYSV